MISVIVLNSVYLAIGQPESSLESLVSSPLDFFFFLVLTIELILKIIAFGFRGHPNALL